LPTPPTLAGYRNVISWTANVEGVIPLPRAGLLTASMLLGVAFGMVAGVAATALVTEKVRPDAVVGLVVGVPSLIGLVLLVIGRKRWMTALGVFSLAVAPGWFGVLVAIQAAQGV
jgi:Putative holin